jgi:hypothetical protein
MVISKGQVREDIDSDEKTLLGAYRLCRQIGLVASTLDRVGDVDEAEDRRRLV